MTSTDLHPWDLSPEDAARLQVELRESLVLDWDGREVRSVAGVDVSVNNDRSRAAVVVLTFPGLTPLEAATAEMPVVFPYIPGLLAFREGPVVLAAWGKLSMKPDLVMFDGQGIAHPRGMGIACLLGLWLERPSIGVAKSRLYGRHVEPGPEQGNQAALTAGRDRVIGAVVRTRTGVKPLYVSPGHLIDVPHSIDFVLRSVTRYRLPEPTRWAHLIAGGAPLPGAKEWKI